MSLGNVLGSNIANLTIILGLAIVLSGAKVLVEHESEKELVQFLFVSSTIRLFVVQKGSLSLMLGIVLIIFFIYFSFTLSKGTAEVKPLEPVRNRDRLVVISKFSVSMAMVIVISKFTVDGGIGIADFFGVPPSIVGATVVGLGTSLPELTTTIQAFRKGMARMALGNIFGSCITNTTLVLGASSVISGSQVNITAAGGLMFFVLLSSLYVWYLISTRRSLDRKVAYSLIAVYILFVLQELGFSIFII